MKQDNTENLTQLGSNKTEYNYSDPSPEMLEVFPNQFPDNVYEVVLNCEEFTSLCPKTGQPDFAKIKIKYAPNKLCVETKSLKLYLFAFRNCGTFMETITNQISKDLSSKLKPRYLDVEAEFYTRGGIQLTVGVRYAKQD